MKKSLLLLFLLSLSLRAQNTVVSSTMTDTDGTAWAGAMWKIDFRPGPSNPNESAYRLLNGQPLTTSVTHQTGSANISGQFSFTIYDSTLIVPTGSGWTLTLCSTTSGPCGTYQFSSAGSSMDISNRLTTAIAAPRFPPGNNAYGYADVEVQVSLNQGSTYWNVLNNTMRVWNGVAWSSLSSNANNPGGNNLEVQINNNGTFGAASGVTYDGSGGLNAKQFNAFRYASQWAVPPVSGSNGVRNAAAPNMTVIADPGYANTEVIQQTTLSANPFHYIDNRSGYQIDFFRNPQYNNIRPINIPVANGSAQAGQTTICLYDFTPPTNANSSLGCTNEQMVSQNPGFYYGATTNTGFVLGTGVAYGGQNNISRYMNHYSDSASVSQVLNIRLQKNGIGDAAAIYEYFHFHGGAVGANDESGEGIVSNVQEDDDTFIGTCTQGCTIGSTNLQINASDNTFGVGRYWYDLTAGAISGHMTNVAPGLGANPTTGAGGGSAITLDAGTTVPISSVWGTIGGTIGSVTTVNVNTPAISAPPFTSSQNFNVTIVGGAAGAFVVSTPPNPPATGWQNLVCFNGNFHDQGVVTAVNTAGPPSGGVQNITVTLRYPHIGGSYIMQGGMCGNGLEVVAMTYKSSIAPSTSNRYLYDIIGSTDAHTLQVVSFITGNIQGVPFWKSFDYYWQTQPILGLSCISNLCSGSISTIFGTSVGSAGFQGGYFVFSGFVPAVLNANCTNLQFSNAGNFSCTIAGSGTVTATTNGIANVGLPAPASGPANQVNMYPIAQGYDSQNETPASGPPVKDGTITIEPNFINFAPTHNIYQANHYSAYLFGFRGSTVTANPFIQASGYHMQVGGKSNLANELVLANTEPNTTYVGYGGLATPPTAISLRGNYSAGIAGTVPSKGGSLLVTTNLNSTQSSDPSYSYGIFNVAGRFSPTTLYTIPYTGELDLTVPGPYTVASAGTTFSGPMSFVTAGYLISGNAINWAPYSNNLRIDGSTTWSYAPNPGVGTGTVTCNVYDDLGFPACTIASTGGGNYVIHNVGSAANTAFILNMPYTIQARIQSPVTGAQFVLGVNNVLSGIYTTSDTAWHDYCFQATTIFGGGTAKVYAYLQVNGITSTTGYTINISNIVVRPGPVCGPPVVTQASQILTPVTQNLLGAKTITGTVASGTADMSNGGNPVSTLACSPAAPITVTSGYLADVVSTDSIKWSYNSQPGILSGSLILNPWVGAGTVGFLYCNPENVAVTPNPGTTINWSVTR